MKYYVSRTHVEINEAGRITGRETVITKPDTLKATKEALRRYTALGITDLHLCEHPANSRRWGKLDRAANKLRKTRKMTLADVAADLAELEAESRAKDEQS
tara:strand:- start:435 stop:737 length:303 start_codon:yes stop_codon:yes gene_type:complete